ncbi:glucosamine-6-phosphate deaminase [Alkalithermobacter paradoxus]|uniref:Glucosamine-6-phosphate deaminase n=1 Tax=Alkalithermobacter paradoxus TaxID=29349 RepID=A0A1V4IB21_9FIRM|nr:glucosamine-6-phosphate deaminase 1 [[Clostridium] thermoalcaliphilum]
MKLYIVDDYNAMSKKAADIVSMQIKTKQNSVIGLATGSTPIGMYKELIKMHRKEKLDFSKIKTFNLDEYYKIHPQDNQSYRYYMMKNFFNHINIDHNNINIPNGMTNDTERECKLYEEKIQESGGIDLQILGIGTNAHIGFNEPNNKFEPYTHLVNLDKNTIKSNSRFFRSVEDVPAKAISMGIKTIMSSRKILLLANGDNKAQAIFESLKGPIVPQVPGSILQLHKDLTVIIDKKAARYLEVEKTAATTSL